jgi:uncharacterized protein
MEFEWDPAKNAKNIEKHGIDFDDIRPLFSSMQPYLDKEDEREDYGEEMRIRLGWVQDLPLCVVYTIRGAIVRPISARPATPAEEEVLVAAAEGEKKLQRAKWLSDQSIERAKEVERKRIESKKDREEN